MKKMHSIIHNNEILTLLNELEDKIKYLKNLLIEDNQNTSSNLNKIINDLKNNSNFKYYEIKSDLFNAVVNSDSFPELERYIQNYIQENPEKIYEDDKNIGTYLTNLIFISAIYFNASSNCLNIFIKGGIDLNIINEKIGEGTSLLSIALKSQCKKNEKIKILMENGENPNSYEGSRLLDFCNSLYYSFDESWEIFRDFNFKPEFYEYFFLNYKCEEKNTEIILNMKDCDILIGNNKLIHYLYVNKYDPSIIKFVTTKGAQINDILFNDSYEYKLFKFLNL